MDNITLTCSWLRYEQLYYIINGAIRCYSSISSHMNQLSDTVVQAMT